MECTGRAAFVIDDITSIDPWHVRGIEVRGRAETVLGPRPLIRIHPERMASWASTTSLGADSPAPSGREGEGGEGRSDF